MKTNISIFSLLSFIFLNPPEIEFLRGLHEKNIFGTWPISKQENFLHGIPDLLKKDLGQSLSNYHEDLVADYFELFVGTGKCAHPYESVYLGKEGILFDHETLAVRSFYLKYGLTVDEINKVPDDHLGFQLNFISELLELSLKYYKKGEIKKSYSVKEDLYLFIKDHPIRWIELFCSRVEKHSTTFFYRGISRLTRFSLFHLYEYLGKIGDSF